MRYFFILLGFCTAFSVGAQEMVVEYIDGILEIKQGSEWIELDIGDSVEPNNLLKLGEATVVEISGPSSNLTLTSEGIYQMKDLLEDKVAVASWNLGSALGRKLKALTGERQKGTTAVMGTRGAAAGQDTELKWMDEEEELLLEGKRLLAQGVYEEAIEYFLEGYDIADPEDEDQYQFYLGYAHAMLGKNGPALGYLSEVSEDSSEPYFSDLVLLKGQLLVESLAFEQALRLFDLYINAEPEGEHLQASYYLSAICLQGLERKPAALQRLNTAQQIDPASELGQAAAAGIRTLNN